MIKKTNTLLASAVAAGVLMMAAQGAAAADKAAASSSPAAAIEQRMKMMEEQMQMMKAELARVRAEGAKPAESSAKLEDRVAKLETTGGGARKKNNMVFFRGGFARLDHDRGGDVLTNINNLDLGGALGYNGELSNGGDEGWYFGAGFDFSLTDNMWGLLAGTPLNNTELLAELMFEYKNFDHQSYDQTPLQLTVNSAVAGGLLGGLTNPLDFKGGSVTVSELTISAAPKIKFMEGSNFRPWIIPLGFAFHINTPTSDGVTYFNPGMVFGGGADYKLWKDIYIGADARYHLTANDNDAVSTDGLTAGGYLGIGF